MSWTSAVRRAAFAQLPKSWQPVASFHYYRVRSLLERELPIACRGIKDGSVAVDVGANEGVYTHAFARTGARVEAFEPQPSCLEVLRSYERAHSNVRVHGHALGATAGWATLVVPHRDGLPVPGHASLNGPQGLKHDVEVRPLDELDLARADVIKIDVEGREMDVIRGASATIARCQPMLLVEIEQRHLDTPMERVFAAICDLGYQGYFVDPRDGVHALSAFSREAHQPAGHADLPGRLYVNNFIFAPSDGSRAWVLASS
jgi:FkbM family methyltransferase